MAIYRAAGFAVQNNVTNTLSNTIAKVVTRQLPDNIPRTSDNYIDHTTNQILSQSGIQMGNIGYANTSQRNLVDNALNAAQAIASSVSDGSLNERNYETFLDYDENDARQFYSSVDGEISRSVNTLYDTVTSFSIDNQTDRRLFDPGYDIASDIISSLTKRQFHDSSPERLGTLTSPNAWSDDLIPYHPKFKYLYIVEFNFYPEYQSDIPTDFTFLAYKFDKPKISVNHEEVNFYNFRTQVPTKTSFGNISLEIHDDIKSASMNFLVAYLRRVSPIFNQESSKYRDFFETSGMSFGDTTSSYNLYTTDNNVNIIESIKVYHIYNANKTMDLHIFNNPKLTEANLHDFDMASGETGCSIGLEFAIDNYSISAGVTPQIPEHKLAISELGSAESEFLADLGSINDLKYTNANRSSSDISSKTNSDPLSSKTNALDYLMGSTTNNPSDYQSIINSIKSDTLNGISDTGQSIANSVSGYNTEGAMALKTALSSNIDSIDNPNILTNNQIGLLQDPLFNSSQLKSTMDSMLTTQNNQPIVEPYDWSVQTLSDAQLNLLNSQMAAPSAETEAANNELKSRVGSLIESFM